jgi:hypothetical protein
MRIFVEDNRVLKIRREGIFLCLDASAQDNLWEGLYDFIKTKCRSLDIPFKIGFFSCDREFEKLPSEDSLLSNNFAKKGRFITPLMEDLFSGLKDKNYDLLVLAAGKIYDWDDWRDEINSKFNSIYSYSLKSLSQMNQSQLEEMLIADIFGFKIGDIKISFEDGIVYEFPDEFKISFLKNRCVLTGKFENHSTDVPLKTYGPSGKTNFLINIGDTVVKLSIKDTLSERDTIDKKLGENDAASFLSIVEGYKEKEFEHLCPLCQNKHKFSKAFICNQQQSQSQLFAAESVVFSAIETERLADSKYAVFWPKGNKVYYRLFSRSVICPVPGEFIIIADSSSVATLRITQKCEFRELEAIHKGLFYYPDKGVYILKLG